MIQELYCINLQERPDKLQKLQQNIENTQFDCKLNVVEGIKHKNGEIGCGLSHQKIIRQAQQKHMDKILVLEDDCLFHNESYELFQQCMQELPVDFDIFVGGVHSCRPVKKISNHLCQLQTFTATHFILYNHTAYSTILEYTHGNIDYFLSHQNLKIYCSYPFIATQATCFSDIKQTMKNYTDDFQVASTKISRVIG